MKLKINKTSVEKLTIPDSEYCFYWDTELPGFGVRVTWTGIKAFVLQKRIKGVNRRITLGRYPAVTPEIARKEAFKKLGIIASGGDPIAEKTRTKLESKTLEQAFQDYIQVRDLSPSTVRGIKSELNNTFKAWKSKPITKITRRMVRKCYLDRVTESKSRANVAMRYLRAVFNLAISEYRDLEDNPILSSNPVDVLSQSKLWRKVERRKTVLKPSDLESWVPAVMKLGETPKREAGTGKQYPKLRNGAVHGDLFLFASMTGCRKSEALGLLKSDVNFSRGLVTFRDTKNHSDHELPLTDSLIAIIKRRIEASPTDFVFASPHEKAVPSNFRTSYTRIKDQTGLTFTLHDLRRLAATSMERLGIPGYTIKAILNHKTGAQDVTGGYVQVDDDMMLEALKKLEIFINNFAQTNSNIVNLHSRVA